MVSTLLVHSICHTLEQIQGSFMNIIECEMKKIPTINIPSSSDKAFTFLLLNTRSFSKHTIDISIDKRFYQADIFFAWQKLITAWKVYKYGVISGPYFPAFNPNTRKYRSEITPYLDTFHAVQITPEQNKSMADQHLSQFQFI